MSVTIKQQPATYTPAFNRQIFVALSNQTAQPNFIYTVVVSDLIAGTSKTYPIPKRPDNYCIFDAAPYVQAFYTEHFHPKNLMGWQRCTGCIRKVTVNIGETYGSGTPVYTAGTNITYTTWNGVVDHFDFAAYNKNNYLFGTTIPSSAYLSSLHEDETYPGRSNFLYVLTSEAGDVASLTIDTFEEDGTPINTSYIANPYEASTTYTDKYLCIDVGHKGLSSISGALVTGDYPIMTADCAYYTVSGPVYDAAAPAWVSEHLLKRFTVICEPRHDVYTVQFLAKSGAFETINFSKVSETVLSVTKDTYKKLPYTFSAAAETYTYNASTPMTHTLSSERTDRITLRTDWLSQDQVDIYAEILDSPVIYLDQGITSNLKPLRLLTNTYLKNRTWNNKLFQLQMDFETAYSEHRQR